MSRSLSSIALLSLLIFSACSQAYDVVKDSRSLSVVDVGNTTGGGGNTSQPNSKMAAFTFSEIYDYDNTCSTRLNYSCKVETVLEVGEAAQATCSLLTSEVAANTTCLPTKLKSSLLRGTLSITAYRQDDEVYRVSIQLTEGFKTFKIVNTLEGLNLSDSEEEIAKL